MDLTGEIIAMNHSFHGRSLGALSVTGNAHYQEPFRPLIPGIKFAEFNNLDSVKALINEKTAQYAALQSSALAAARRGYIDDIIKAGETRQRVIAAFEMLFTKREDRPSKKHGTV